MNVRKISNSTVYHPFRTLTKMPMITLATPAALPGVGTVYFQTMTLVAFVAIAVTTTMTPPVTVRVRRLGVEMKYLDLFRFLPDLSASLQVKRGEAACALTSSSCIPRSRRRTRRVPEKRRFLRSRRQRLRYVNLKFKRGKVFFGNQSNDI